MDYRPWSQKSSKPHTPVTPLRPGQPFPLDVSSLVHAGNTATVAVISLYCPHCIEMLPGLIQEVRRHRIPFILVSRGTAQENANIASYFKATFPVVSVTEADMRQAYGVAETPYFYFVRGPRTVVEGFSSKSAADVAGRWLSLGKRRV